MMFITDINELKKYTALRRIWQGIPGIEVTANGRIFSCFYSGGTKEEIGNYVILAMSEDGENFTEPIAVVFKEDSRCFDPCLWIDPLERLWLTWSVMPNHGTYAVICENPDSKELSWSDEFFVGHDVMMNKPTVLSTGEWLFPIAVWSDNIKAPPEFVNHQEENGAFVYQTTDNGKTFVKIGGTRVKDRSFDEHMILELNDGRLTMFVRTYYGIAVSYSYDRGYTWTEGCDSGIKGPSSRFFIRRLKSGRILLINHYNFCGRNNLAAFLSEDEGKTWPYTFLLDERSSVSYPDAVEDKNGFIHIIYDRERGALLKSLEEAYSKSREILYSKITEGDIIAGQIVNSASKLKCVISALGKYYNEDENPYENALSQGQQTI